MRRWDFLNIPYAKRYRTVTSCRVIINNTQVVVNKKPVWLQLASEWQKVAAHASEGPDGQMRESAIPLGVETARALSHIWPSTVVRMTTRTT